VWLHGVTTKRRLHPTALSCQVFLSVFYLLKKMIELTQKVIRPESGAADFALYLMQQAMSVVVSAR
jgi:hypothetical protein